MPRLADAARVSDLSALDALLAGHGLPAALTGTSVAAGSLSANGQTATVAIPSIRSNVLETLDVLGDLSTQGTFHHEARVEQRVDGGQFLVVEIASRTGHSIYPGYRGGPFRPSSCRFDRVSPGCFCPFRSVSRSSGSALHTYYALC